MPLLRPLLLGFLMLLTSSLSFAQIGISVSFGPPALPVYEQPLCPGDGYLWTPGYWAWDPGYGDYYWVPGTWVLAPEVGYLWTPGWWGWGGGGGYFFHQGYWGPHVGYYGGIAYGFGYYGSGYEGGRWDGGHFAYNRAVNNVNVTVIHNTYNTKINNVTVNRVSYNGGNGGITARPTPEQQAAEHERHLSPVAAQTQHVQQARSNPQLRASVNLGRPPIAATSRPAEFNGRSVVAAREAGAPYHAPTGAGRPPAPTHASQLQPHPALDPVESGRAQADQRYQQQQSQLIARQNQQHQQLQLQQQADHQRATQQNANPARQQQMEQQHQQQTMQLEQRHTEQQQRIEQRAPQPSRPEGRPR